MPAAPTATPEHIRDVNERYHDAAADEYDAKWGIDFGEIGRDQTRQKLTKALGEWPAAPVRRRAGDRLGHRLLLAQPDAGGRDRAARPRPTSPAGCCERSPATRGELGLDDARRRRSRPTPSACPSTTTASTSCSATRSCTTSPTSPRPSASSPACCDPAAPIAFCGEPSRYGDRLAALPKRFGALSRRSGGAWSAPRRATAEDATASTERRPRARERGRRPRLRPRPPLRGMRDAGFEASTFGRGAARQRLRLVAALGRVERRARGDPVRLAQLRLPQLHRPAEGRRRRCSSRACPPQLFYNLVLSARTPASRADAPDVERR